MLKSIHNTARAVIALLVLLTLVCGGAGIWAAREQSKSLDTQRAASRLLFNHMNADMMHDAIRSDIFNILLATRGISPDSIDQVRADLAGHVTELKADIARDMAFTQSPEIHEAAAGLEQPLADYTGAAQEIAQLAVDKPDAVAGKLGNFSKQFRALEQTMANASATIENYAGKVDTDGQALSGSAIWTVALSLALALAALAASAIALLQKLVRPMLSLSEATAHLADGTGGDVPLIGRSDELGELARSVDKFRIAGRERAQADAAAASDHKQVCDLLADALRAMAKGDLSDQTELKLPPSFSAIGEELNGVITSLRQKIFSIVETVGDLNNGSHEIATAAEDMARRTEANAGNLEQAAGALAQIDSRLKSTTQASLTTVERADRAISTLSTGRETADGAVAAMGRVSESAKGIDSVIEGLDKIAFQTRVLAMNAAVEAGRAGDAGRGFAVVADLVSALAMRAEEEAGRAREQLTVTQAEIGTAVDAVHNVDEAFAAIAGDVEQVHALLSTMSQDNIAQSDAVTQIATSVGSMELATQQTAAMVEETSASARQLSTDVETLVNRASAFRFSATPQSAKPHKPATSAPAPGQPQRPATNAGSAVKLDRRTPAASAAPAPAANGQFDAPRPQPLHDNAGLDDQWSVF